MTFCVFFIPSVQGETTTDREEVTFIMDTTIEYAPESTTYDEPKTDPPITTTNHTSEPRPTEPRPTEPLSSEPEPPATTRQPLPTTGPITGPLPEPVYPELGKNPIFYYILVNFERLLRKME